MFLLVAGSTLLSELSIAIQALLFGHVLIFVNTNVPKVQKAVQIFLAGSLICADYNIMASVQIFDQMVGFLAPKL